jgi:succinate dehydrogenase / fumarate reductase cytochrome b subunit
MWPGTRRQVVSAPESSSFGSYARCRLQGIHASCEPGGSQYEIKSDKTITSRFQAGGALKKTHPERKYRWPPPADQRHAEHCWQPFRPEHSGTGVRAGAGSIAPSRFLDLMRIQMPVGALTSIGHRISGVVLAASVPAAVYLLRPFVGRRSQLRRVTALFAQFALPRRRWSLSSACPPRLAARRRLLSDVDIGSPLRVARRSALVREPSRRRRGAARGRSRVVSAVHGLKARWWVQQRERGLHAALRGGTRTSSSAPAGLIRRIVSSSIAATVQQGSGSTASTTIPTDCSAAAPSA